MGCVFSTEQDEKKVKQTKERRPSQQQQQQQQQQSRQQQQQHVVNGQQRPQQPLPVENGNETKLISRNKTPSPIGNSTFCKLHLYRLVLASMVF